MLMQQERLELVDYGKRLITEHLTTGTGGNLSVFDPRQGLMAITPSGIDFFATKPEDIVIMDLDGNIVEGIRKPSSEVDMHRILYRNRPDIRAAVHTHSMFATTISCMGWEMEPVHYIIGVAGGSVRCAPYRTFGTWELAESALEGMRDRYAVLLGNHGLLAAGATLDDAFSTARGVEFVAEIYYRTKTLGSPRLIEAEQLEEVLRRFQTYGQQPQEGENAQ